MIDSISPIVLLSTPIDFKSEISKNEDISYIMSVRDRGFVSWKTNNFKSVLGHEKSAVTDQF